MLERECSLRTIREPVRPSEAIFFGNSRNGEWLTWKPPYQNVMLRNVFCNYTSDITYRFIPEVVEVGLPRILVPIG